MDYLFYNQLPSEKTGANSYYKNWILPVCGNLFIFWGQNTCQIIHCQHGKDNEYQVYISYTKKIG